VYVIKTVYANVYDIKSPSSGAYRILKYQILIHLKDDCRNGIVGLREIGLGIVAAIQETEG
jgi:hypothetical protein